MELARRSKPYPLRELDRENDQQMGNRVLPYADEIYLDIHRESLLEHSALFPTRFIVTSVHVVSEGNLLVVPRRK